MSGILTGREIDEAPEANLIVALIYSAVSDVRGDGYLRYRERDDLGKRNGHSKQAAEWLLGSECADLLEWIEVSPETQERIRDIARQYLAGRNHQHDICRGWIRYLWRNRWLGVRPWPEPKHWASYRHLMWQQGVGL